MARALLPHSVATAAESAALIAIAPSAPGFLACLSATSLELRSLLDPHLPLLSAHSRDADSVRLHGSNHWLAWVTRSTLAFGTCAGAVFLARIADSAIAPPAAVSTGRVITGAFACHGALGVCTQDCALLILGADGAALASYAFDFGAGGFRGPRFYAPSVMVSLVSAKPCFLWIPLAAVRKPKKLDLSFFSIENAVLLAYSATREVLAAALADGSVVLVSSKAPNSDPTTAIAADAAGSGVVDVIFLQWVCDDSVLVVARRDGRVALLNKATGATVTRTVPELQNAASIAFDGDSCSLLFCDSAFIKRVEFASVSQSFAFTCTKVIDYADGVLAVPEATVFPVRKVVKRDRDWAIASSKGLFLFCNGAVRTTELNVCEFAFYGDSIFVFAFVGELYWLIVFDLTLRELHREELPHAVHSIFQRENVILFSSHSRYSMVTIGSAADAIEIIPGSLYASIRTWTVHHQLKAVLWMPTYGIILHLWNDHLHCPDDPRASQAQCAFAIVWDDPEFLLVQGYDGYTVLYLGTLVKLLGLCLFTDGVHAFSLEEQGSLGEIKFAKTLFGHFFALAHPPDDFASILTVYEKFGLVDFAAGALERMACGRYSDRFGAFLDAIYLRYSPAIVCQTVTVLLYRSPDLQRDFVFGMPIKWGYFFHEFSQELKQYVLLFMSPVSFDELVRNAADIRYFGDSKEIESFIREATLLNRFLRGFAFATQFGLDYLTLVRDLEHFQSNNLNELLVKIETDANKWTVDDDRATLRFFGTTLSKGGLMTMAVAVFIVLGELPKIEALMLVSADVRIMIEEFARTSADSQYSERLRPLLQEENTE
jgi:hypothetical protein